MVGQRPGSEIPRRVAHRLGLDGDDDVRRTAEKLSRHHSEHALTGEPGGTAAHGYLVADDERMVVCGRGIDPEGLRARSRETVARYARVRLRCSEHLGGGERHELEHICTTVVLGPGVSL